jgi:hypothetical protein
MPNGRSGGFVIETADLKQLVTVASACAVVGELTTGLGPHAASAAEIARCIEKCPHDRVAVEEQDNTFYIIHFNTRSGCISPRTRSTIRAGPAFISSAAPDCRHPHRIWMGRSER